jgi:hypothetical protein
MSLQPAIYSSRIYERSKRLRFAHEIEAWEGDNDFILSAYRYTFDRSVHCDNYITDVVADQLVDLDGNLSLASPI